MNTTFSAHRRGCRAILLYRHITAILIAALFAADEASVSPVDRSDPPLVAENQSALHEPNASSFRLIRQDADGVEILCSFPATQLLDVTHNGEPMQRIILPGVILPNREGAPNLPTISRFIAIPHNARIQLRILSAQTDTLRNIYIEPSFRIPPADNDEDLHYRKDEAIYRARAWFPVSPAQVGKTIRIRGVDAVSIVVTPFQFNPGERTLIKYRELHLRVELDGGAFADSRLRDPWWEPILHRHLLNYASLGKPTDRLVSLSDSEDLEYIILCPDDPAFIAWADTIRQWRSEQGVISGVITLAQIGGNDTTLIRAFLENAYWNWDIPPAAVLLLGDFAPTGNQNGIDAPRYCGYPADNLYADMDGDALPDLVISRISAENEEQLANIIGKMLENERNPSVDPEFYRHPVTAGAWHSNLWGILCEEVTGGYLRNELGKDPVREYGIGDGSTPDSVWSTCPNTSAVVNYFGPYGLGYIPATPGYLTDWGGNAARLNRDFNQGAFLAQYSGHGWEMGWCLPGYGISDLNGLDNTNYPYIISSCCLTGRYDNPTPCFAEAILRMSHGALGINAAASPTYAYVNDVYVWGMNDYFWSGFDPAYGSDPVGTTHLQPAFAGVSGKYYLEASAWPLFAMPKIITYYFYLHHGDAFLQIYSEVPESLTVQHDSVLVARAPSFRVNADPGSWIALSCEGMLLNRAQGTGEPLDISVPPLSEGQGLRITVTKDNYFRYIADVPIVDPELSNEADHELNLPHCFHFNPPYPNPFNPSTALIFDLPHPARTTLAVFDVGGRMVWNVGFGASDLPSGTHRITFDGSDLPSGIYFARLQAGEYAAVKKMVLVK
jgi:hypothetical protein